MFKIQIPKNKTEVVKIIDDLIKIDYLKLENPKINQNLGMYVKPLRRRGILKLYYEDLFRETIGHLEVKDVEKKILPGRKIEYIFNIKIPSAKKTKFPRI